MDQYIWSVEDRSQFITINLSAQVSFASSYLRTLVSLHDVAQELS